MPMVDNIRTKDNENPANFLFWKNKLKKTRKRDIAYKDAIIIPSVPGNMRVIIMFNVGTEANKATAKELIPYLLLYAKILFILCFSGY